MFCSIGRAIGGIEPGRVRVAMCGISVPASRHVLPSGDFGAPSGYLQDPLFRPCDLRFPGTFPSPPTHASSALPCIYGFLSHVTALSLLRPLSTRTRAASLPLTLLPGAENPLVDDELSEKELCFSYALHITAWPLLQLTQRKVEYAIRWCD